MVNLVESTHIIRVLVSENKIGALLQEHDQESLDLFLDNISPAHMAFQAEVLDTSIERVVVYYFRHNDQEKEYIDQLKVLAKKYDDQIKFVIIDVDKLFSLARDAEIEAVPTIFFMENKEIVDRLEGFISIETLEEHIKKIY